MKEVFVYRDKYSWVSYIKLDDGRIAMSAHTKRKKYSFSMLKAMRKTIKDLKEVHTVLPFSYLVDFYSKHFKVEKITYYKDMYKISLRS